MLSLMETFMTFFLKNNIIFILSMINQMFDLTF